MTTEHLVLRGHLSPASAASLAVWVVGGRVGEDVLVGIAGRAGPGVAVLVGHLNTLARGGVGVDGLVAHVQSELLRTLIERRGSIRGDAGMHFVRVVLNIVADCSLLLGGTG